MPAGKLLACEPYGPLGTIGPRGLLCFGGRQAASEKYHKQPTSPFMNRQAIDPTCYEPGGGVDHRPVSQHLNGNLSVLQPLAG
jgi:hypothetical protein